MKIIGVIGAGQMGRGIAQVCAGAGLMVVLQDISAEALTKALEHIGNGYAKLVAKGKLSEVDKVAALARLTTSTDVSAFKTCDMVIEAATENEALKIKILQSVDAVLPAGAIIASNTSSISITRLAAATKRPARFIGMHFMNPVPVMQLVEVIRGLATSDETYAATVQLAEKLGKTVALAQDYPGFIVNRILMPMINEAITALMEGVGTAEAIDAGMKLGTNQPMGPLELADFIGLDTCLAIMRVLHNGLGDSKYRPSPLLVKYVDAGWLGRKSGQGFYSYTEASKR
jgi:3-hydroxybutyryl-CoA dehydrogenase